MTGDVWQNYAGTKMKRIQNLIFEDSAPLMHLTDPLGESFVVVVVVAAAAVIRVGLSLV